MTKKKYKYPIQPDIGRPLHKKPAFKTGKAGEPARNIPTPVKYKIPKSH